jgi:osmotically-inducible protein OsmY
MRSDSQIRDDVIDQLRWEPTVTSADIGVTVRDGVATLTGTVPYYAEKLAAENAARRVAGVKAVAEEIQVELLGSHERDDTDIAGAAVDALAWHVWVPSTVKATVEKGIVTLTGEVRWEFERNAAFDAVRYLDGVKGVRDLITIKPKVKPTEVKDKIEKAFERNAVLDAKKIKVQAVGGDVTLSGNVRSWAERAEAYSAAYSAPGVKSVANLITVSS